MTINEIADYVMNSPHNTNRAILLTLLNDISGGKEIFPSYDCEANYYSNTKTLLTNIPLSSYNNLTGPTYFNITNISNNLPSFLLVVPGDGIGIYVVGNEAITFICFSEALSEPEELTNFITQDIDFLQEEYYEKSIVTTGTSLSEFDYMDLIHLPHNSFYVTEELTFPKTVLDKKDIYYTELLGQLEDREGFKPIDYILWFNPAYNKLSVANVASIYNRQYDTARLLFDISDAPTTETNNIHIIIKGTAKRSRI